MGGGAAAAERIDGLGSTRSAGIARVDRNALEMGASRAGWPEISILTAE
jgi:hypothetical protein